MRSDGFSELDKLYFKMLDFVNPGKENGEGRQYGFGEFSLEARMAKFPEVKNITIKPKDDYGYEIVRIEEYDEEIYEKI